MKWFRFYDEVLDDPKVQSLRPELFKIWVNLLCLASKQKERGTLPSTRDIAFRLRLRQDRLTGFMEELRACNLLVTDSKGQYQPHNWEARQRSSDDVAVRVKRHRDKTSENSQVSDVTLRVSTSDSRCSVTESALEGEGDTEGDKEHTHIAREPDDPKAEPPPQALRTPDDRAKIDEAIRILTSDIRTEHVGMELGRNHGLPELIGIEGWKWVKAAKKATGPSLTADQRRSFPYITAIARRTTVREDAKPANHDQVTGHTPDPAYPHGHALTSVRRRTPQGDAR